MFAKTSGKLSNHSAINKVYVVEEDVHLNKVCHTRKITHTNTLKGCWIGSSKLLWRDCEHFRSSFIKSSISMQMQTECSRESLSLCGFLVFFSLVRKRTVWFFASDSGNTESSHHMVTSLSRTAKTVTFMSL